MRSYLDRHLWAAVIHFVSFATLLSLAAHEAKDRGGLASYRDQFFFLTNSLSLEPREWKYTCAVDSAGGVEACPAEQKQFYVTLPPGAVRANAIAMASSYAAISGCNHLLVWWLQLQPASVATLRWVDYTVTAPTMLSIVGLIYGAVTLTAVVIAPALLAVLLIVAGIAERAPDGEALERPALATVALLCLLYPFTLAPALVSAWKITETTDRPEGLDKDVGIGEAPDFVFVFAVATVVAMSSFAVVYVRDALAPLVDRERAYIKLSLIAKTTLHLFIGITVIGQGASVSVDEPGGTSDMDNLVTGLAGATGLIAAIVIGDWLLGKLESRKGGGSAYVVVYSSWGWAK